MRAEMFAVPPSHANSARRAAGEELGRLRQIAPEDAVAASERAQSMPWWPRVIDPIPTLGGGRAGVRWWCWRLRAVKP
jgi:hypothetical protein